MDYDNAGFPAVICWYVEFRVPRRAQSGGEANEKKYENAWEAAATYQGCYI